MEDPVLNRNLEETRELQARWSQFRDFFYMALKTDKVTPQAEKKFLDLKTRIAMLHDGFMQSLKHDHNVGQNVMSIIAQCIMLKRIALMSAADVQKLELDWNEVYLLVTGTVADLEEEQDRLANINERAYKMQQFQEVTVARAHNFLVGPWFKVLVVLGVLGFIVIGVPVFGLYDYYKIRSDFEWSEGAYDRIARVIRSINPNLSYVAMAEVEKSGAPESAYRKDNSNITGFTETYFYEQFINMGFDESDLREAKELYDRKRQFEVQIRVHNTQPRTRIICTYILFQDASDAESFLAIRRRGIEKLSGLKRTQVETVFLACGKSNFVAVFASDNADQNNLFASQRFQFEDNQMGL